MTVLAIIALLVLFGRWTADDIRSGDLVKALIDIAGIIAVLLFAFAPGLLK